MVLQKKTAGYAAVFLWVYLSYELFATLVTVGRFALGFSWRFLGRFGLASGRSRFGFSR